MALRNIPYPPKLNAVDFIIQSIHRYPNQVSILAIAPLTNIALAMRKDPTIIPLIKQIVFMAARFTPVETLLMTPANSTGSELDSRRPPPHEECNRVDAKMYKFFTSPLPPSELISKLSEFTDTKKVNPIKPSLYEGEREIIAQAEGTHFTAQKRVGIGWGLAWFSPGLWFKPVLTGSVTPLKEGSGVIFEGGTPIPIKVLWALLIVIAATAGGMFLAMDYPATVNFDGLHAGLYFFSTIMGMNTALGILVLLPLIGWWLTRDELGFVAAAIENKVQLQPVPKSALDDWQG